jgi:hypothetical protein
MKSRGGRFARSWLWQWGLARCPTMLCCSTRSRRCPPSDQEDKNPDNMIETPVEANVEPATHSSHRLFCASAVDGVQQAEEDTQPTTAPVQSPNTLKPAFADLQVTSAVDEGAGTTTLSEVRDKVSSKSSLQTRRKRPWFGRVLVFSDKHRNIVSELGESGFSGDPSTNSDTCEDLRGKIRPAMLPSTSNGIAGNERKYSPPQKPRRVVSVETADENDEGCHQDRTPTRPARVLSENETLNDDPGAVPKEWTRQDSAPSRPTRVESEQCDGNSEAMV